MGMSAVPVKAKDSVLTRYRHQIEDVALSLGWKPTTLWRQTQAALPSPVEQQIYLSVVGDLRLQPRTMAKLMRIYMREGSLRPEDLSPSPTSKFRSFVEFLAAVLDLLRLVPRDYARVQISAVNAAQIILHYGTDYDTFLSMIEINLPRLRARFGFGPDTDYGKAMSFAISWYCKWVLPARERFGRTDPLTLSEGAESTPSEMERDSLAMDADTLRSTSVGRRLRDYGVEL
jgi:hypothetical protein